MKQRLLATVAVAAAVGFGGIAAAQETQKSTSESMQDQKGTASSRGTTKQPSGQAAQSEEKGGKQIERLGQSSTQEQKGIREHGVEHKGAQNDSKQKGAREERNQKRAQEQRNQTGAQEQRNQTGAQEERNQKGAQEQRNQKGAQEERGGSVEGVQENHGGQRQPSTIERGTTEQGQAGVTGGGGRGGSVQLSEQQRSKIKTIVTEGHAQRFSGNVNFDVRVGTRIPSSVHVVPLPEDIVRFVPEYRGYDYILVRDEILIVDPNTLEIVAVIPA